MKIEVDNIKIFIEILRIEKQSVQNLYSDGSTQIVSDTHTSLSKCILLEIVISNNKKMQHFPVILKMCKINIYVSTKFYTKKKHIYQKEFHGIQF